MRILLKLSGEMIGDDKSPFLSKKIATVGKAIRSIVSQKNELAIVIGGGNIWRYRDHKNLALQRIPSDFLGMLATLYNANCLKAELDKMALPCEILSRTTCPKELATPYKKSLAEEFLRAGKIVILAGGTGKSGFSTDTGAALLAEDTSCEQLWKSTKVNGVYDSDPMKNPKAKRFSTISYADYLDKKLGVMDLSAIEICAKKNIPVRIFKFSPKNFADVSAQKNIGSLIK